MNVGRLVDMDQWVRMNQRLVAKDQDNVTWYSGKPGDGKSTLELLLNRKLDPTFQPSVIAGGYPNPRVTFGNGAFLQASIPLEPGEALQGDELDLFARGVMKADQMDFLEWQKDSRGRGLHMSLTFPEESLVDEKMMLFRCRWRIHVAQPFFWVYVPKEHYLRDDSKPFGNWREVYRARFPDITGPLREAYRELKELHMRDSSVRLAENLAARKAQRDKKREKLLGSPGDPTRESAIAVPGRGYVPPALPEWNPSLESPSVRAPSPAVGPRQRKNAARRQPEAE